MDPLAAFSIPISSLKEGAREYKYDLNTEFFRNFESSLIGQADMTVSVLAEKRQNMVILDISLEGTVHTTCDRCVAPINLPISQNYQTFIKQTEVNEIKIEEDVIYVPHGIHHLPLANHFYELAHLSLPRVNAYDCYNEVPKPCDSEALARLNKDEVKEKEERDSGVWDALKDLDFNNN